MSAKEIKKWEIRRKKKELAYKMTLLMCDSKLTTGQIRQVLVDQLRSYCK